jgi:competence protein ComEC
LFKLVCWAALPGLAAGALAGALLRPAPAGEWDVAACDVGQGDGLVVRTGEGSAIVVDTGPDPEAMDRCLDGLGVERIDLLVLTHMHLDHYGGLAGALAGRETARVLYSSAEAVPPAPVLTSLEDRRLQAERAFAGLSGASGAVAWAVHWPVEGSGGLSENDASIVLDITLPSPAGGSTRMLLTGDLEEEQLPALMRRLGPDFAVDVLKVSHHGARNGGTALITALRPAAALISVGAGNDYGHPADEILAALKAAGTHVLRTDELGTVLVDVGDRELTVRANN